MSIMKTARGLLGGYGGIIFTVSDSYIKTFDELSRRSSARFADHEVAGQKPISEKTGEGLDEITFTMRLTSALNINIALDVMLLNRIMSGGTANRLIVGSRNLGKFTLREMEENWIHVGRNGTMLVVDIVVTLCEYIDTFSNQAKTSSRADEVMKSTTGKGGPDKLPGSPPAATSRDLTPIYEAESYE